MKKEHLILSAAARSWLSSTATASLVLASSYTACSFRQSSCFSLSEAPGSETVAGGEYGVPSKALAGATTNPPAVAEVLDAATRGRLIECCLWLTASMEAAVRPQALCLCL